MAQGEIRAGRAFIEIGTDNNALSEGLNLAKKQLHGFGTAVASIGKDLLKLGNAIMDPIVAASVAFAKMGNDMSNASARTGIAVEALSQLGYAAKQSGVDMESLEMGIRKMQQTIGKAEEGSSKAVASLERLGLTFEDLKGMTPDAQLKLVADRMNQFASPADKTAIAMEVFGKSGTALIPMLQQGGKGMTEWQERAKALGLTMSGESAAAAKTYWQSLEDLRLVFFNGLFRVGEAVAPVLQKIANIMLNAGVAANKWITEHKGIVILALKIGAGITVAGSALLAFAGVVTGVGFVAGSLATAVSFVVGTVSLLASVLTSGVVVAAGVAGAALVGLAAFMGFTSDTGRVVLSQLGQYFKDLKTTALSAFGGITDALQAGEWKLAADVAMAGVKLAFAQGINPLKAMWVDFKYNVLGIFESLHNAIAKWAFETGATLETALTKALNLHTKLTNAIGQGMAEETQQSDYSKKTDVVVADLDAGKITQAQAAAKLAALRTENEEAHAIIRSSGKAQEELTKDQLKRDLAAIDQEEKASLAMLQSTHDQELKNNQEAHDTSIADDEADLQKKKAALSALTAKAKEEAAKHPDGLFGKGPKRPNVPSPEDFERSLESEKDKHLITFNPNALGQIAGRSGNPQEKAQDRTAEHQKRMEYLMRMVVDKVGGAFG